MGTWTVVVSEQVSVSKFGKGCTEGLTESQARVLGSLPTFTPVAWGCTLNPIPERGQQDGSVGRGACSQTYREEWGEKGKSKFIK